MSKELMNYSEELRALETIADHASKTKWFESLGGKAGMTMIALYARELQLPVMQCLFGGMKAVLGKVELSPVMMNALIRKSGHSMKTIVHTNEKCELKGKRRDTGEEMVVSFSIEDAKKAGIYKGAWITYPKNMTYKSCLSNLAKWLFPDVIGPSYIEGEIPEDENKKHFEDEQVIEVNDESPPGQEHFDALLAKIELDGLTKHFADLEDYVDEKLEEFFQKPNNKGKNFTFEDLCKNYLQRYDEFIPNFKKWLEGNTSKDDPIEKEVMSEAPLPF